MRKNSEHLKAIRRGDIKEAEIRQEVYVVVVRYSTGDSFGTTHGAWHLEGVYQNFDEADAVKNAILSDKSDDWAIWKGYFETLEYCEVVNMLVEQ